MIHFICTILIFLILHIFPSKKKSFGNASLTFRTFGWIPLFRVGEQKICFWCTARTTGGRGTGGTCARAAAASWCATRGAHTHARAHKRGQYAEVTSNETGTNCNYCNCSFGYKSITKSYHWLISLRCILNHYKFVELQVSYDFIELFHTCMKCVLVRIVFAE